MHTETRGGIRKGRRKSDEIRGYLTQAWESYGGIGMGRGRSMEGTDRDSMCSGSISVGFRPSYISSGERSGFGKSTSILASPSISDCGSLPGGSG